ncbi:MAG: DUF2163 domain-containing protein [Anaplasma sp.]
MKDVTQELLSHISQEIITTAHCCKLTLKDKTVIGLTDCDSDLNFGNILYRSGNGINLSHVCDSSEVSVAYVEVIMGSLIAQEGMSAESFDHATAEIFLVNYENLSQGKMVLFSGTIAEFTTCDDRVKLTLEGVKHALLNRVGELFSPHCRAKLCDSRCGLAKERFTFQGSIERVVGHLTFEDTKLPHKDGYYKYGVITFSKSGNRGVSIDVRDHREYTVHLVKPAPHPLLAGDTYSITAGCDKNFSTCRTKFDNVSNFRGEPHVPDLHSIYPPMDP